MQIRIQPCPRIGGERRPDGTDAIEVLGAVFDPARDFALVSARPACKGASVFREIEPGKYLGRAKGHRLVRVSSGGRISSLSPLEVSRFESPGANGHEVERDRRRGTSTIVDLASGRRTTLDLLSDGPPRFDASAGVYYLELDGGGCAAVDAADYSVRWLERSIQGCLSRSSHPDLLLFVHRDYGANATVFTVVDKASGRPRGTRAFRYFASVASDPWDAADALPVAWGQMLEERPGWTGAGPPPRDTYVVRYDWVADDVRKTRLDRGQLRLVREECELYVLCGEIDVQHPSNPTPARAPTGLRILDATTLETIFERELPECVLTGDLVFAGGTLLLPGFAPPDWSQPGDAVELLVAFAQRPARGDAFDIESVPLTVEITCETSADGHAYRVRYAGDSSRFFDLYTQLAVGLKQTAQRQGFFTAVRDPEPADAKFAGRLVCDLRERTLSPLEAKALEGMLRAVEQDLASYGYVAGADRKSPITIELAAAGSQGRGTAPTA
jgi:hypothetical protein